MVDDPEKAALIVTHSPGKTPGGRSWTTSKFALSTGPTPPPFEMLRTSKGPLQFRVTSQRKSTNVINSALFLICSLNKIFQGKTKELMLSLL